MHRSKQKKNQQTKPILTYVKYHFGWQMKEKNQNNFYFVYSEKNNNNPFLILKCLIICIVYLFLQFQGVVCFNFFKIFGSYININGYFKTKINCKKINKN